MKNLNLKSHVLPAVSLAACLLAYAPTFSWMWYRWFREDSYYSHGWIVPFFSAYLIWEKREELAKLSPQSSRWGIALILVALLIYAPSALLRVYSTAGFSLLIAIAGLVLHFYGKSIFKTILFPITFLFFMVPLPSQVIIGISFRMKLFAATIATQSLNAMNVYAVQNGSYIQMRSALVMVDDACSGLRSLITLIALGSVFAYWLKAGVIKKLILFLTTIPIAIITNVCRVIFLCLVNQIWGAEAASGAVHDIAGYMVFVLAFIILYAISRVLEDEKTN